MSQRSVFCIAASRHRADRMVHELKRCRYPGAEISILFLDQRAIPPEARESKVDETPRPARAMHEVLRWIKGMGRLVISDVVPQVVAPPQAVVLRGMRSSAAAGANNAFTIVEVTTTKLSLLNALGVCHAEAA